MGTLELIEIMFWTIIIDVACLLTSSDKPQGILEKM